MNLFAVMKDGSIITPRLTGTILEGITRDAVITLLRDSGHDVIERDIALEELRKGVSRGDVDEIFACGTAAVITPVGRLVSPDFDYTVGSGDSGKVTMALRERLTGIQYGRVEDVFGWMRTV